jgi:hypothetical protein
MKVIIAGGRDFNNYKLLRETLDKLFKGRTDIEIVSGACNTGKLTYNRTDGTIVCGADGLGEKYARERGYPVTPFPADWSIGKSAGYIRNKEMAMYADALVAFWDGQSRGTGHMIDLAKKHGLKGKVINY